MKRDLTFEPESRYGSARWCATALGLPLEDFRRQRANLEAHSGFPKEDPLIGSTIKSAVDDWIKKRKPATLPGTETQEDFDYAKF